MADVQCTDCKESTNDLWAVKEEVEKKHSLQTGTHTAAQALMKGPVFASC